MKYKTISKSLITTSIFTLFLLNQNKAYASPVSLSVYPPVIEIETTTPTSLQTPVIIQNNSNQKVNLNIGVKPFKASDNFNGQVNYFPSSYISEPDKNIFKDITLLYQKKSISSLILSPKEKKNLSLSISLPANEPTADYYFSLIFTSSAPAATKNTSTLIQTQIATNILLSIGQRSTAQAEIYSFSSPFFISHGPVPFHILLKNDTSQILKPQGHILVTNMFGQTIGNIAIPQQYILASSLRYLSNGFSSNDQPVSLWNESFLLGPYSAKIQISLSNKGPILQKTIYFFAFPLQAVALLLVILVLTIIIFKRVRKKANYL